MIKSIVSNIIEHWVFKPAKWWQFWYPMSGVGGGFIFGTTIFLFLILLMTRNEI